MKNFATDNLQTDRAPSTNALTSHVAAFSDRAPNGTLIFSVRSIGQRLVQHGDVLGTLKGFMIFLFNSVHSGGSICPGKTIFKVKEGLHLGTTRIYDENGNIDEERWREFVKFITLDNATYITANPTLIAPEHNAVRLSTVSKYLAECSRNDTPELHTGRNANGMFASKAIQVKAASAAWGEFFVLFTCGWLPTSTTDPTLVPFVDLDLTRKFFADTKAALEEQRSRGLPVAKPVMRSTPKYCVIS